MPSQTTSPPLTVTVLAALWVSLGRCDVSEFLGPRCDNGKLSLERDLPEEAAFWDCPVNERPTFSQMHPSVDTVHDPEPARQICMDKSISYKHAIPNSGAYRPVRAESGEYLYCPPQRWLNNLHHAATVLLYHPCAPADERLLLSALARACLHDYIITPHPQLKHMIALVSWGRTLELSTLASSDVCDWLDATASTRRNEFDAVSQRLKYNLLLTKSAEQHRQHRTDWGSLRQCCEQTISSLLIGGTQAELNVKPEHLKHVQDEGKSRKIRAALTGKQGHFQDKKVKTVAYNSSFLNNQTSRATFNRTRVYNNSSLPGSRNLSDPLGPREAEPQSKQNVIPELTSRPTTLPLSDVSETMLRTHSPESQKRRQRPETPAQHFNLKPTVLAGGVNSKYNHTARTEDVVLRSKDKGTEHVKEAEYKQKQTEKGSTANGMEDNEVVDVKEREVEREHRHEDSHPYHKSEETQSASKLESQPQPQSDGFLPSSRNCDGCKADERCECDSTSGSAEARAPTLNNGLPRTPRTDEAVWAAAALGFLLILLTLSILHTRLYRHWRTAPSLYWHDPQLDYDSVADVIRRRLRIVKRRQKRSRRQECVLLPSSSSSDEHP
ncbi:uncharacterized protein V6R79_024127 [Siganus canaliculatus]